MGQLMQYVATNIRDGSTSAFFEKMSIVPSYHPSNIIVSPKFLPLMQHAVSPQSKSMTEADNSE